MRFSMMDNDSPPPYMAAELNGAVGRSDGRVDIDLDSKLGRTLSKFLLKEKVDPPAAAFRSSAPTCTVVLNIVIQVVGSRGDVQPFVALGQELKRYGHRVRLATHNNFEGFVKESGLEFYPIGGDPVELMAFMVKNPGLIPSMDTLRSGEVQKKRAMILQILEGCWESCIQPDTVTKKPFVAEAIIANPPSFAHIHCAQALGIPVHLMFTMPWSSTTHFPHPLANIRNTTIDTSLANYLSYGVVEWLTWQGLGDVVNTWRKGLELEPLSASTGPLLAETLGVPFTYCWSPALVPKPTDWATNIDVCGFFFREPPKYTPLKDLDNFLRSGPRPIYIGFGSIVIDDPERMTCILLKAVIAAGVRAIISRGWSKLGGISPSSDNIFYLDDSPHEWLFQWVSAVVHHGGAGTTACGILNGLPNTIIPFFGDQPFWGEMVAAAGAGPQPIHNQRLTVQNLTEAIKFCLQEETKIAAEVLAQKMRCESGVQAAAASFHRNLPLESLSCELMPQLPAAWLYTKGKRPMRLSKVAAEILLEYMKIEQKDLKVHHTSPIVIINNRWDPITGGVSSLCGTAIDMGLSLTGIVTEPIKEYKTSQKQHQNHLGMEKNGGLLGLKMAASSAKSVGMFNLNLFKGTMVDLPMAVTEGLNATPKLYGEKVVDHGVVSDWKSGAKVAGKSFTQGMYDGFTDIVIQPYNGSKEEGALGFAKGIGKGVVGLTTKVPAALIGLVAYPSQGIVKSFYNATHTKTKKSIVWALRSEGSYLRDTDKGHGIDSAAVIDAFMSRIIS